MNADVHLDRALSYVEAARGAGEDLPTLLILAAGHIVRAQEMLHAAEALDGNQRRVEDSTLVEANSGRSYTQRQKDATRP